MGFIPVAVGTIEGDPLTTHLRATQSAPILEAEFTALEVSKESNVRQPRIVISVGVTAQVPIDSDLINLGAQHITDGPKERAALRIVGVDGVRG